MTEIDPASCRGFEDEAFQALFGLIHYSQGNDRQRNAWYQAVWNTHQNATGTLRPGPNNKSFFYSAILNRKNSAFGYLLAVPPAGQLEAGLYPWALDDAAFNTLNAEVKLGKGPAGGREVTWSELTAASAKWQEGHNLSTPVAAFGWVIVTGLVKKYAPRLAATLLSPELAAGTAALGFTAVVFNNWTVRLNNAAARRNFAIDEQRRNFDLNSPIGSNEIASVL